MAQSVPTDKDHDSSNRGLLDGRKPEPGCLPALIGALSEKPDDRGSPPDRPRPNPLTSDESTGRAGSWRGHLDHHIVDVESAENIGIGITFKAELKLYLKAVGRSGK